MALASNLAAVWACVACIIVFAGCVEMPTPEGGNLTAVDALPGQSGSVANVGEEVPSLPPMVFEVLPQGHLINYRGGESSNRWDNVTIEVQPVGCRQDAPTTGAMVPGQIVHVTADEGVQQCTLSAAWDGHQVDAWVFDMEAQQ